LQFKARITALKCLLFRKDYRDIFQKSNEFPPPNPTAIICGNNRSKAVKKAKSQESYSIALFARCTWFPPAGLLISAGLKDMS